MKRIDENTSLVVHQNNVRRKMDIERKISNSAVRINLGGSVDDAVDGAMKRQFDSGISSRLNSDVRMDIININWDLRMYWRNMVGAARELAKNNPYFVKYLQMREVNIVGHAGIVLQSQCADRMPNGEIKPDLDARRQIEEAFWEWSQRENCSVDGTMSLFDMQKMASRTPGHDGEMFFQIVRAPLNKFNFAIQPLDPIAFDPLRFDDHPMPNGNKIINGVETNSWFRPIAYHMRTSSWESPNYDITGDLRQNFTRMMSGEIIHIFSRKFPGQTRGIPHCHACMNNFAMLKGYSEAELVAARASASKFVEYYTDTKIADPDELADLKVQSQFLANMAAGGSTVTPYGYKMQLIDPKHPTQSYPEFVKAQLREIAAALGVAYNSLANDLQAVNFSSLRSGVIEERDNWKMATRELNEQFNDRVFYEWLKVYLTFPTTKLPFSKFNKFYQHAWHGRKFAWVDPEKDLAALKLERELKLKSPSQQAAESGEDYIELCEAWKIDKETARKNGLSDPEISIKMDESPNNKGTKPEENSDADKK